MRPRYAEEKTMKKPLLISCLVVAIIVGFISARRTSPFFNFLLPPSDKFVPLASAEIDLSRKGMKVELPFKPKYPGNHQLDLEVEKLDLGAQFRGRFLLDIQIRNKKNETVITGKVAEPSSAFWGNHNRGFTLQSFAVPGQIGLGETAVAEIRIITPDAEFAKIYGQTKLAVRKGADE